MPAQQISQMTLSWDQLTFATGLQLAAALGALACLVAAAIDDAFRYRISNVIIVALVVCFAGFAAAKGSWEFLAWSLAAGACTLALAAVPFAFGIFGGGDTKLIAAMALWTQFAALPRFVVVMSAFGGALGVIWIIRRRRNKACAPAATATPAETAAPTENAAEPAGQPTKAESSAQDPAAPVAEAPLSKLPYGIAIALAGIEFFVFGPFSPLPGLLPGLLPF